MKDALTSFDSVKISRYPQVSPSTGAKSTDGRIIYAIGDIHGCYDLLSALLEAVVGDVAAVADSKLPLLVFCGDYIDRGPKSSHVMATMVWLSRHAPLEVVFLKGNHEAMLLDFLDHPDRSLPWLTRDGKHTLSSYGVQLPDSTESLSLDDCYRLRNQLMDRMPVSHIELIRQLPVRKACGDYLFVHAGLKPGVPIARQDDEDCLWIDEEFRKSNYRFPKIVVHGHSWDSDEPQVMPNRIGIDTGAYSTGVLTAVRLDAASMEFIQARSGTAGPERHMSTDGRGELR